MISEALERFCVHKKRSWRSEIGAPMITLFGGGPMKQVQLLSLLGLSLVYTKYASANDIDDGYIDSATNDYFVDSSDRLVLASLSFFFAVCLSLVSSILAYCVYTEDQILRNFISNGIRLEAKVVEYTLTNISRRTFVATIDYRYNSDAASKNTANDTDELEPNDAYIDNNNAFATIIRKRIKCVESDLILRNSCDINISPSKRRMVTTTREHCQKPQSVCIEIRKDLHDEDHQGSCYDEEDAKFPSFDYAVFNPPHQYYVDVVVLPDQPTSAIGYQQLMHSLDHFPIIVLLACLSLLVYFCLYMGVVNLAPRRGLSASLFTAFVVWATLLSTEIIILSSCCHDMINEMLSNELLSDRADSDDDNYFNFKTEDETLYTMPSSFGGTALGTGQSASWKHSSPNLCSLQTKQQQHPLSAPSTPSHQMDVLYL